MKRKWFALLLVAILLMVNVVGVQAKPQKIAVNVLFSETPTADMLKALGKFGKVGNPFEVIPAVSLVTTTDQLDAIRALPYVVAANPDAERSIAPLPGVQVEDFTEGIVTWNLDSINVGDVWTWERTVPQTGENVYVAVLDTGLIHTWPNYFPEERIAEEYAIAFQGGANENSAVAELPNKWEHDNNSHGTHVTSTILGFDFFGNPMVGVAPRVQVIPVKVLNQNGSGTSGMVARGIEYVGELKAGPLADYPVVINMSLGGPVLDPVEQAAIDFAISQGVIIVASAGNNGTYGMGYPGAYEPVISVAAAGWLGEWYSSNWWYALDDPEPTIPGLYYITDFSSRELPGQDLDVAAPGSWIVGPYQLNSGTNANQLSYYFLGGTSMASPHVAGVVALMAEKYPALTAAEAEGILEATALPLLTGCVVDPYDGVTEICWGADAIGHGLVDAAAALSALP